MIPRYQLIVFRVLIAGSLLMAALLVRGCVRDHRRILAQHDLSPIPAPTDIPDETVSVALANDADGSIAFDQEQITLPPEGPMRARAILEHVMGHYALADSLHPLAAGQAIADVYFLQLPLRNPGDATPTNPATADIYSGSYARAVDTDHGQLAVIDLKGSFVNAHPSGIEVEDLTLRSLVGTLHANFPQIDEVQFLVDGKTRDTLAGHADLLHAYPAVDTSRDPLHTLIPTASGQHE